MACGGSSEQAAPAIAVRVRAAVSLAASAQREVHVSNPNFNDGSIASVVQGPM